MQQLKPSDFGFWLFTKGSYIYLINGKLPFGRADELDLLSHRAMVIGALENQPLWLVEEFDDPREYTFLRNTLGIEERTFNLYNRGVELNHFFKTHQFCGKCGHKTEQTADEWAMQCQNEACGYRTYPVICPSIIVAVRRGNEILLANHLRHKDNKMYTTLAGFVEVGESFEQTVEREVFEETGIKVKNIQYVGSQPWAFPNSEMVAFIAEYASGEIQLQEEEIYDAKWFNFDEPLPELPPEGTIARKLINLTKQICQDKP